MELAAAPAKWMPWNYQEMLAPAASPPIATRSGLPLIPAESTVSVAAAPSIVITHACRKDTLVPVVSMIERRWSPDKSFLLLQRVESVVMGFEQLAPQDIPEWWNKPHPKAEGAASDNAHRAAQLLVMAKLTAGFLVDWANDIEIEERARPTTPVSTGANAATTPSRRNETAAMAQAPAAEPDNPFKGRVLPAGMRDHD